MVGMDQGGMVCVGPGGGLGVDKLSKLPTEKPQTPWTIGADLTKTQHLTRSDPHHASLQDSLQRLRREVQPLLRAPSCRRHRPELRNPRQRPRPRPRPLPRRTHLRVRRIRHRRLPSTTFPGQSPMTPSSSPPSPTAPSSFTTSLSRPPPTPSGRSTSTPAKPTPPITIPFGVTPSLLARGMIRLSSGPLIGPPVSAPSRNMPTVSTRPPGTPAMPDVFASASGDCTVRIWDVREPGSTMILPAHKFEILSCDWNKYDDCVIATASVDKSIKVWDVRSFRVPVAVLNGHSYAVRKVKFSPHRGKLNSFLFIRHDCLFVGLYGGGCSDWEVRSPHRICSWGGYEAP
ncbi:peroxin 7 [Actinidia rufa]|uniref:Peroxin-7 n=1 Tax=Actinidia rufa TaxID=165716 RepID=A0A7J0G5S5_9ERIC|nr:peroxin 7 [Actinidia rufa]